MRSATSWATSVGVVPTSMPHASSASFFACAVPRRAGDDRARVAHRLAGRRGEAGDVREHRLRHVLADERAAFSSSSPPISPTMTMSSVCGSASNFASTSMNEEPTTGSPPMPTIVELPSPSCVSSWPIWYVSVPERETRPTAPSREDLGRDDPDVRLARREHARAVRARSSSRPSCGCRCRRAACRAPACAR